MGAILYLRCSLGRVTLKTALDIPYFLPFAHRLVDDVFETFPAISYAIGEYTRCIRPSQTFTTLMPIVWHVFAIKTRRKVERGIARGKTSLIVRAILYASIMYLRKTAFIRRTERKKHSPALV